MPSQLDKLVNNKVVSQGDADRMNDAQKDVINNLGDDHVNNLVALRNNMVDARKKKKKGGGGGDTPDIPDVPSEGDGGSSGGGGDDDDIY